MTLDAKGKIPASVLPITTSAALPGSPTDGQQWIYQDLSNLIRWQFVYYAADGYWYFIGGAPLTQQDTAGTNRQNSSDASWQNVGGLSAVTAPFAGDYTVTWGCGMMEVTNTNDDMSMGLSINGATPSNPELRRNIAADAGVADWVPGGGVTGKYTVTAGQTLAVQIFISNTHANVAFWGPFLSVWPRRVH